MTGGHEEFKNKCYWVCTTNKQTKTKIMTAWKENQNKENKNQQTL